MNDLEQRAFDAALRAYGPTASHERSESDHRTDLRAAIDAYMNEVGYADLAHALSATAPFGTEPPKEQ